ncbi:leucine-rich repeat domain-containing protein [Chryseobacterium culicis]|uniref:leucine-rich repeat domain-containing protein n=1 Tax=Chryseobacterium culicis TaxID=680127 RepID=UPI0018746743|nr:leucine-rich repeat domain-containing protein [Chryseobacterium culicis]MBE4950283.1 leucine-rich repeat domain-containing protein [Chryseobacterium culicis]
MKTKEELKLYFENGDIPKQEDFWEWQNSYWHKSEKLPNSSLELIAYEEFLPSPTDHTEIMGIGKRIVFPEGIKVIGGIAGGPGFLYQAAAKNIITQVTLPSTLERIKANAFGNQFITGTLRIPGSCKIIETSAFSGSNSRVSELILENGIETIDNYAFQLAGATTVTELYIPKSVKSVGQNAFNIPSLKKVSVKQGLDISNAGIPATATILYYADI